MASADLEHIRALLIAQTAAPEPRRRGFRLFGARRSAPDATDAPLPIIETVRRLEPLAPPAEARDADQALLLERICTPPPPPVEVDETLFVEERLAPLPPPAMRDAFGRRSEPDELVLTLDRPDQAEPAAVPFFPEDFEDPIAGAESLFAEPQPMRPWIKALRDSRRPPPVPVSAPAPAPEPAARSAPEPASGTPRPRPVQKTRAPAEPPPRSAGAAALSRDLLEALELALLREHHQLSDRLAVIAA